MSTLRQRLGRSRFIPPALALFAAACLFPTPALALKMLSRVTPETLQAEGFSVKVEEQQDGTVGFTLSRDLGKVRQFPADSGLRIARTVTLRVHDPAGLRAECSLAPVAPPNSDRVTYRFTLARDCLANSTLTVAEDADYAEPTGERLLGGGTHYEFALGLFAGHSSVEPAPK